MRVILAFLCLAAVMPVEGRSPLRGSGGVASFLRREAQRLGSEDLTSLAQVASTQPSGDAMDNVKTLIRHMIATKMSNQAESTTKKAFCDSETVKSKQKVQGLQDKLEKENADMDKMTAEMAEAQDQISDLTAEVADGHKSMGKATEMRQKEHDEYSEKKKAYEQAESSAIHVSSDDSEETRKAQETAAEVAMKQRIDVETKEAQNSFAYDRQQKDGKESVETKTKQAKDKEHEIVRMKHDIQQAEQDIRGLKEEMDASKSYEDQITAQCVHSGGAAKERKARREEEIGSLKDAYQMLNGDGIWVPSL